MSSLGVVVDPATVIVAVDPGKVLNRVWVGDGSGLLEDSISLPVSCEGIGHLERSSRASASGDCPRHATPLRGGHQPAPIRNPWMRLGHLRAGGEKRDRVASGSNASG